jgi:hypothetical protein
MFTQFEHISEKQMVLKTIVDDHEIKLNALLRNL